MERERIDRVAAQPALDLRARLAHRARHRRDVAGVFAQERDELVTTLEVALVGRTGGRRSADGFGEVLRLDRLVPRENGGARQALLKLADVERPRVAQQRARRGGTEAQIG